MKKMYFLLAICLGLFANAQIVTILDANFKAKLLLASPTQAIAYNSAGEKIKIDVNNDGEIQVSEALLVHMLTVSASSIADLTGVQNFTNLYLLDCNNNQLTTLDVSNLLNLQTLKCSNNALTTLNLLNQNNLSSLECQYNNISSLLLVEPNNNLQSLKISSNNLTSFDFNAFPSISTLTCGGNPYTTPVNIDNLAANLSGIEISGIPLNMLPFNNTNAPNFINLYNLYLENIDFQGQFNNFNFGLFPNLNWLFLRNSIVNEISISSSSISQLAVSNTGITTLDLTNLPNLTRVEANNLHLSNILFNYNAPLELLFLGASASYPTPPTITNLDLSAFNYLNFLTVSGWNQLTTLNIKNGFNGSVNTNFNNCPNLKYICADNSEITAIQNKITIYGYTNCHVNTYCTFEPGGTFYTIQGTNKYDFNNNGCDANDINASNVKLNVTSGSVLGSVYGNFTGSYNVPVQAGTHVIAPQLENPSYFTISPSTSSVTFPTTPSPFTQDFCLTPNGTHNDLEITILPVFAARAGFDATYKILYKNKGTHLQSGNFSLSFDDSVMDFLSASSTPTNQTTNNLTWSFSNLQPFESRVITLVMNLNSPTENPPLNVGTILNYNASINGATDETPIDNTASLNQIVVNSFDPNDKTCLEGTTITLDKVGEYVHYLIRFENTGTANAQNIVVKDIIDTTKYDIATLIPLDGSHNFYTRITNTNQVEFIFENIQLPFDDTNNDGYVAFKIKTKSTLTVGDSFSNAANIYFDYNFPIVTNTATTIIQALGNSDFEFNDYFTLSPVPTKDVLYFDMNQRISVSSINIYNTLGQLILVETNPSNQIDVSNLLTGNYFIKVISDKGTSTGKFIKQ